MFGILTHIYAYLLTPQSRDLLENVTGFQLIKKFPAYYGNWKLISANSRHLSLTWATSIQSMPSHSTSWKSNLILSCHLRLGLPSGLFPSDFPIKTLYTLLLSRIHAICPAHLTYTFTYTYVCDTASSCWKCKIKNYFMLWSKSTKSGKQPPISKSWILY